VTTRRQILNWSNFSWKSKVIDNRVKTEGSDTVNSLGNFNQVSGAKRIQSINFTDSKSDLQIQSESKLFKEMDPKAPGLNFYEIQKKVAAQVNLEDSDGAEDLE